jgi:hypothetical protein
MVYDPRGIHRRGLLSYRPLPQPDTSLNGYVIYLTAANRYVTPANFLFTRWSMPKATERLIETLARKTGYDPDLFRQLTFRCQDAIPSPHPRHSGGISISQKNIHTALAKICPTCWSEKKLIKKEFEVGFVTACPDHGRKIVNNCLCGRKIQWSSLVRDQCCCGVKISEIPPTPASDQSVTISRIYSKIYNGELMSLDPGHSVFKFTSRLGNPDRMLLRVIYFHNGGRNGLFDQWMRILGEDWGDQTGISYNLRADIDKRVPLGWYPERMIKKYLKW